MFASCQFWRREKQILTLFGTLIKAAWKLLRVICHSGKKKWRKLIFTLNFWSLSCSSLRSTLRAVELAGSSMLSTETVKAWMKVQSIGLDLAICLYLIIWLTKFEVCETAVLLLLVPQLITAKLTAAYISYIIIYYK